MRPSSIIRIQKQKCRSDLEDYKGKAPEAPEKVQNGVYTMLIVPVIIEILAVAGIILLIIRIHCSKR